MTGWQGYSKAIVAFLLAGLTALGAALADNLITQQEWIDVAIAAIGTLATVAGVYATPNRTASRPQALDESMAHEPDM